MRRWMNTKRGSEGRGALAEVDTEWAAEQLNSINGPSVTTNPSVERYLATQTGAYSSSHGGDEFEAISIDIRVVITCICWKRHPSIEM